MATPIGIAMRQTVAAQGISRISQGLPFTSHISRLGGVVVPPRHSTPHLWHYHHVNYSPPLGAFGPRGRKLENYLS